MKAILQFLRRRQQDTDLAEELEAHLAEKTADLMDAGVPETQAREQAMREFGNVTRYREIGREVWGWVWLETLWQDISYGARQLRTNPGFTAVAVATLALGIAVNSSIFSVVSALLLNKPAITDPDRVAAVVATNKARSRERGRFSALDAIAFRTANQSFEELAAVDPYHDFSLTGDGEPERVTGMRVTADYFRALGISTSLGRTFLPHEDEPGRDHVLILSHALWTRRFASDPHVVGRSVDIDGDKYVVIGVLPASFRQVAFLPRLWTPLVLPAQTIPPKARDKRSLILFGRLKRGIGMAQARSEMEALTQRAEQSDPASEKGWNANVMSLQEYGIQEDEIRAALTLLMSAVALVLLIACANIANLLLARATRRHQEIAIRTALGAGRMRVIRQLLVESLLIALLGGGAGLVAAVWGVQVLRRALSFNEYVSLMAAGIRLDHRVLIFTFLISIAAALIFGLAPAIRVSSTDPQSTLRQGRRAGDLRRGWGRHLLVGSQIALAMVLVIGACLLIKATMEDLGGDYGFNPHRIIAAPISLTSPRYHDAARQINFLNDVLEKLRAMPGVEAAAISNAVPFFAGTRRFDIQGQVATPGIQAATAHYLALSPGAFKVLTLPIIQGRAFRDSDNATSPRVAIVNRVFAERFFPGQNAIGHYIRIDHTAEDWSQIVGIAGDVRMSYTLKREDAQMFEPYLQVPPEPAMWMMLRAPGQTDLLIPALRHAVWSIDPNQPIGKVQTIAGMVDEQQSGDYVFDTLLGTFGILALMLACIGIYGVIAYAVAQRTHEIGIRMALGASRADVLRPVIAGGMLLAFVSAALGLLAAAPLPSLFAAMLGNFRVHSAAVFLLVPMPLLLVVLVAIYIPASRAAKIDAMEALRYQ